MNQKDYKEIARIIIKAETLNSNCLNKSLVVLGLADYFDNIDTLEIDGIKTNRHFNRKQFLKDCLKDCGVRK